MTALEDQCDVIRGWLNIGDDVYPNLVVTSWIRMAEERLSKELRCKDQIQIDTGSLIEQRYRLPSDWRQLDFVRVIGGKALRYVPRDDFYNPDLVKDQSNCYTLAGNYIITAGNPEGLPVEITYYQDLPPLGDTPTWPLTGYTTLYLISTLHVASMYAIEDERGPMWEDQATNMIGTINTEHARSKASGSRLTQRHRRTFG